MVSSFNVVEQEVNILGNDGGWYSGPRAQLERNIEELRRKSIDVDVRCKSTWKERWTVRKRLLTGLALER